MTRKERRYVIEGIATLGAILLLALFVLPALINLHDTTAFFAAMLIIVGAFAWVAYFIYRLNGDYK